MHAPVVDHIVCLVIFFFFTLFCSNGFYVPLLRYNGFSILSVDKMFNSNGSISPTIMARVYAKLGDKHNGNFYAISPQFSQLAMVGS